MQVLAQKQSARFPRALNTRPPAQECGALDLTS